MRYVLGMLRRWLVLSQLCNPFETRMRLLPKMYLTCCAPRRRPELKGKTSCASCWRANSRVVGVLMQPELPVLPAGVPAPLRCQECEVLVGHRFVSCADCREPLCSDCLKPHNGMAFCPECLEFFLGPAEVPEDEEEEEMSEDPEEGEQQPEAA